jgi:hypothetical protein
MITFDQREKDQADEKYAQMSFWAEIENVCYDHARELAASLQKYLAAKHSDVKLTVEDNRLIKHLIGFRRDRRESFFLPDSLAASCANYFC